jgi:hypothetical protein
LFLSNVYIPSTQQTFDWAIQHAKSFNFTGNYLTSYSISSSSYQSSHALTLTTQSNGIGLRTASDFFQTGSDVLEIAALITAPGAPLAAALSTLATAMSAASLITVTGAVVADGVRLTNIPHDLSNSISSIYVPNTTNAINLAKVAVLGKMTGLSALSQNLHISSIDYNDALNILLSDVQAGNRQKVRQDIVKLLDLDSTLTNHIRQANLPLQAVMTLADSTMIQFNSIFSQNINNVFASSNTRQSTYLNLLSYLTDSMTTSYADSIKQCGTRVIQANNRVDSLSNELLTSAQSIHTPAYIASVSISAPATINVNSVFTIKSRFQNFGGTSTSNLYAKISLSGGFRSESDSIYVGNVSSGGQDSVQFVITAPAIDTVGAYSIIFVGDNTSYEPVGGAIVARIMTGVRNAVPTVPKSFNLYQSYPNPSNPSTIISYDLPQKEHVTLVIYDVLGRQVKNLVDNYQEPGKYKVTFNGSNLSSGIYFYRLQAGTFTETKKLVLMK